MRNRIQRYFDRRKVLKAVGSFDENGLLRAVQTGHREALEILLEAGISPDTRDEKGRTALHLAIKHRQILPLNMLCQKGADLNRTDPRGRSPLMFAVEVEDRHSFHHLLTCGADPNLKDKEGITPLMLAAKVPIAIFVRELLASGAEVNQRDQQGKTALLIAAQNDRTAAVKTLLEAGADPSIRDAEGNSALKTQADNPRIQELIQESDFGLGTGTLSSLLLKLSALFEGALKGLLTLLDETDSTLDLEVKGKELITQLTSNEQIATWIGKLEETQLQEEISWWLNLLVEVRDILTKQQQLLKTDIWEDTEARRQWQQKMLWLFRDYSEHLDQLLEVQESSASDSLPVGSPRLSSSATSSSSANPA
jgi:hypothetical protein